MGASFLITLREGLEAALVISIVLAYLARTGNRHHFRNIWLGTGAAILASLAAGAIVFLTVGELTGRSEKIFEGIAMFIAVGILSYMVIWMKKQARNIKAHLEAQVQSALVAGSALAMVSIAFIVVVREGVETVLFMFGVLQSATPVEATIGGIGGLGAAIAIGYLGYRGSRWLKLGTFFDVTGTLLAFFAAGLLILGIHEFQEAGIFPVIIEHVWDINYVLNEKEGIGSFLKALFGYNGNPSLVEVVVYPLYVLGALWFFYRLPEPGRRPVA